MTKTKRLRPRRLNLALHAALLPLAITALLAYVGSVLWSIRIAFTSSKLLPRNDWVGLMQFERLFDTERWIVSLQHMGILAVVYILGVLILGTLMDMAPLILILTPILLPVVKMLGVDPVHFGIIIMVNLGIGLLTPPVGSVLFVGSAVGNLKIEAVVKAMYPFFAVLLLLLALVTYVPALTMWLPRTMGV